MAKYQRVLLKLSGEALQGKGPSGIDPSVISYIANELAELMRLDIQTAVVVGGGNFFRGTSLSDRITSDHMGMLGTIMNALALRETLEKKGMVTSIMSAIPMSGIVDHFDRRKAIHLLNQNNLVLFAGGTGNPLVTTDSAASLRSIEIEADILLKATNVDGIYSKDPRKFKDAKLYEKLSYQEALDKELGVMDLTAFCQCRDHHMPIRVFNFHKAGALKRAASGLKEGTLVC